MGISVDEIKREKPGTARSLRGDWLHPLRLSATLGIGAGPLASGMPDWASFLLWCGWWMRINQVEGARIFMVMLLPTRACCSAFCCLGALIGSMRLSQDAMDWGMLVSLPDGAPVYMSLPQRGQWARVTGELGGIEIIRGQQLRTIKLHSGKRHLGGVLMKVTPKSIGQYRISLSPSYAPRLDERITKIASFFSVVSESFTRAWLLSGTTDCALVTNVVRWNREVGEIAIVVQPATAKQREVHYLSDLLTGWGQDKNHQPRVKVSPPRSSMSDLVGVPVAVLDGPDAFRSWENIRATNVLVILERSEYDGGMENMLLPLTNVRDDSLLPDMGTHPENLPPGLDLIAFALPGVSA